MLTEEELKALEVSPICLVCNHREMLHDHDYEMVCLIPECMCTECIVEGAFSLCLWPNLQELVEETTFDPISDRVITRWYRKDKLMTERGQSK